MVASLCEQSMREIRQCCDLAFMEDVSSYARCCRWNNFRVSISRRDYFDRLINLQTAKFAGGTVLISRALQIVVAQPTRGRALIWQSMARATE
jgi:hypothetical protein